jgi:hypothetical protein
LLLVEVCDDADVDDDEDATVAASDARWFGGVTTGAR